MTSAAFAAARMHLPEAPALVASARAATWVTSSGEVETLSPETAVTSWPWACSGDSYWAVPMIEPVSVISDAPRRAIPKLRAGGEGGVLCNVTSSSLFAPVPFYAPYRGSKAAVSAIGESLRTELQPFGIRVLDARIQRIDRRLEPGAAN